MDQRPQGPSSNMDPRKRVRPEDQTIDERPSKYQAYDGSARPGEPSSSQRIPLPPIQTREEIADAARAQAQAAFQPLSEDLQRARHEAATATWQRDQLTGHLDRVCDTAVTFRKVC